MVWILPKFSACLDGLSPCESLAVTADPRRRGATEWAVLRKKLVVDQLCSVTVHWLIPGVDVKRDLLGWKVNLLGIALLRVT